MSKVSVIVLNWNGMPYVEECVEGILSQSFRDFELIVVDNGSTDGSADLLREQLRDRAILVENGENLGYAAGNNRGIAVANGEWIALLNNDAVADRYWLQRLMEAVEKYDKNDRLGMAASKILLYDRRDVIDNTGHLIYPDGLNRGRGRLERDGGQFDKVGEALFPSGCAGLYRRDMLDEIGLLDEDFFAYGEDADLGLRGRLFGWRCLFAPQARVYHRYSAGSGAYSELKAYHVERNRVWVIIKNFPMSMIISSPAYTLLRYTMQAYGALIGKGAAGEFTRAEGRLRLIMVLLGALGDAAKGTGKMLEKRRELMSKARLSKRDMSNLLRKYRISVGEISLLA